MPEYAKPKKGYHFEPTDLGYTIPKVYGKYAVDSHYTKSYLHNVPVVWINEGWVKEVEDGKE